MKIGSLLLTIIVFIAFRMFSLAFGFIAKMQTSESAIPSGATVPAPGRNDSMDWLREIVQDRRRMVNRPHVEAGPGFFKSDPVEYSPDRLAKEFKKLFALKRKIEEENKPLNL